MNEYDKKVEQFREYLENKVRDYSSGVLCSWAESIHGEIVTTEILNKFNEVFK